MTPSATGLRPGFLPSTTRVFDLSLGRMLWSRRSIFLVVIIGAPVALSFAIRALVLLRPLMMPVVNGVRFGGPALFGVVIWLMYISFIVPVVGVLYGTGLIADEVDDKTITYLFTRPIPRAAVLFGKYLAFLICAMLLVLPSVVIVYFTIVPLGGGDIGREFPLLVADLGVLAVGLASYGALFALVGVLVKRPLVAGLLFAFGWEPGVLLFPGYLKELTISYYLRSLVPHPMPDNAVANVVGQFLGDEPLMVRSLISLGCIIVLALWLAGRTVERREYVLER